MFIALSCLMSSQVFSQNAISSKVPPGDSGWLFHEHEIMIGSPLQPQSYLHIHNNADADGNPHNAFLQITNPYTGATLPTNGLRIGVGTFTTDFDAIFNQQEDANMLFYTNNTQRLIIDNTGQVGIGNITPTATLDIDGTFRLRTGATAGFVLKTDAQGNATWQALNDDDPSNEIQDISLTGTNLSITNGSTVDLSSFLDNTDEQQLTINNGQLSISGGNTIQLDAVNYWNKNNNDVYYNAGRVGIGINTPHHNLQIHSTEQLSTGGPGTGSLGGGRSTVDYGAIQLTNGTTGNTGNDGLLIETRGNSVSFWQQENADMSFKIGTSNRLVLKADGKVGIKNNFPNADLDVKGTFKVHFGTIINEFSTDGTLSGNSDEALPTEQAVKTYVDNGLNTINQQIGNLPGPDNLGSHIATENLKMDGYNIANRDSNNCFSILQNTNSSDGPTIEMYGKNHSDRQGQISLISYGNTGDFVFTNYNSGSWHRKVTIKADGKVGIGTSYPSSNLDIVSHDSPILKIRTGTIGQGNSAEINLIGSNEGNFAKINFSNIENDGNADINAYIRVVNYGAEDVAKIEFGTSDEGAPHTKMTILGNGNVGIGTSDPHGYKLAVNGLMIAEDVTISEYQDWPDFVFIPNYSIMPLPKLEKFIKQNGHLPNIPTADEVKENGVRLGEMNKKLLQKVEELTLYVIEQQKEIEALKKEIKTMKKI